MARLAISDRTAAQARLDAARVALAGVLFISPWLLDFSGLAIASILAWVSAVVIALISLAAMVRPDLWEEWVILAMSVGLIVAPYALDFRYLNGAGAAFVGVGCFIFAISISDLWGLYRTRRGEQARAAPR
ncbi:MAG TPA: hypothetical protein VEH76_00590 [Methylocystis sp.]|nr:hypothetical protein [Methylocystis sp.]